MLKPGIAPRLSVLAFMALASVGLARESPSPEDVDLTELEIEDLLDLEITSVAKKAQPWRQAAAAVHVITAEDLRRSGATTLAEALRRVPGLQVAQIDASKWAISARGFNGQYANKLLVLIDGRSVYSPLFSGVFWEVQDTVLEDVERIEVIRGPGATLWGANAVNGVINIITKKASETQGGLLALGTGSEERAFGTFRYGGELGENGHYRVFGKGFDRDGSAGPAGEDLSDESDGRRAGFRFDHAGARDELTLTAELYDLDIGQTGSVISLTPPFSTPLDTTIQASGGHLLGRWTRSLSEDADWTLQFYYDRTDYETLTFEDERDTFDLDFQHRFPLGARHEVIWGLGYRRVSDELGEVAFVNFDPSEDDVDLWSAFVQDEIKLAGERLRLTLGTKLEHNSYTGFEIQPNVRASWSVNPRQTLWAAVARAVRTPARAENDVRITTAVVPLPDGTLTFPTVIGNREVESEELLAFELGYRLEPTQSLYLDLAAFYNDYDQIVAAVPGVPFLDFEPFPPRLTIPLDVENAQQGETSGLEASLVWDAGERLRLEAGYTYFEMSLSPREGVVAVSAEGDHPRHQAYLQSSLDFAGRGEWDLMMEWVDELEASGIPSYFKTDMRLAWRFSPSLELSLVVKNAFDERHSEFRSNLVGTAIMTEIERSVFGKLTWSF